MSSYESRLCRKITINADQRIINVRPIVQGAIKESAYTLTEAYASNSMLDWYDRHQNRQDHTPFFYHFFKEIIKTASRESCEFAVQVEGCKGVMVWTNHPRGLCSWLRPMSMAKLARWIRWSAALSTLITLPATLSKMRHDVLEDYERYITINYMGILPHEQRKGYGSALLCYLIEKANTSQYAIVVQVTDPMAILFFKSFGFCVKKQMYTVHSKDVSVVFMVRSPEIL
ncbi:hypothetical protein BDF14DRAFT_1881721 [Spinellus fusiger]|nr:hypothetical protein BDF14DRAFT_1881721 [Spinellus fusiger]